MKTYYKGKLTNLVATMAQSLGFNNAKKGKLTSSNVQDAIDEVNDGVISAQNGVSNLQLTKAYSESREITFPAPGGVGVTDWFKVIGTETDVDGIELAIGYGSAATDKIFYRNKTLYVWSNWKALPIIKSVDTFTITQNDGNFPIAIPTDSVLVGIKINVPLYIPQTFHTGNSWYCRPIHYATGGLILETGVTYTAYYI